MILVFTTSAGVPIVAATSPAHPLKPNPKVLTRSTLQVQASRVMVEMELHAR